MEETLIVSAKVVAWTKFKTFSFLKIFIKNWTVNVKVIQEYNCLKFAKSNLSRNLLQYFSCNKLNKTTRNLKNKLYKYESAAYYN